MLVPAALMSSIVAVNRGSSIGQPTGE